MSGGAVGRQNDQCSPGLENRFSNDFSSLDIRLLTNATELRDGNTRNLDLSLNQASSSALLLSSLSSSSSSSSTSTSSNIETSVIQSIKNCTNATNANACIGQHRNCSEDLPERVSKLNRTNTNVAPIHEQYEHVGALQTRDTVAYGEHGEYGAQRVGNDRTYSTAQTLCTTKIERITNRETRETQTVATTATNGSSLVNIGSNETLFSRDRLFHASVSSTAHAFFDLFKFSRNSESNIHNLSRSNRENNSQKNSCAVAAMRLNVPNQDSTAVAAREPTISVSTRINHIDNSKTVVNISNAHDCSLPLGTMTTTTSTSCPSASHIFENGTLLGAIVSQAQPSLTIQVNQNDHQSQQTQVIQAFGQFFFLLYFVYVVFIPLFHPKLTHHICIARHCVLYCTAIAWHYPYNTAHAHNLPANQIFTVFVLFSIDSIPLILCIPV